MPPQPTATQPQPVPVQPAPAQTQSAAAPAQNLAYTPLTVADIKALVGAGVKDEVVITEIKTSNSKFTPQDIAELQQAGVSAKVIDFIKTGSS